VDARDPRGEAQALVGDGLAARVLEPSPPAVVDLWFADDPVNAPVPPGVPVVSPIPGADLTWAGWVAEHPEHTGWARERWLGPHRRLVAPGAAFGETRLAVHRLAAYVISPARRRANGRIGLRWTLGGLGTPFFGDDEQIRLQGRAIVRLPVQGRQKHLERRGTGSGEKEEQSPNGPLMHRDRGRAHEQHPVDELVLQPVVGERLEIIDGPVVRLPRHHRHSCHHASPSLASAESDASRTPLAGVVHRGSGCPMGRSGQ
jgi:hypothetical protein